MKKSKTNSAVKKIYKQPPISTASAPALVADPEVMAILGVSESNMNTEQRACLQKFLDVYNNIDKNPFAANMLRASNYCIPNNQYFAQYNAAQSTAQIAKNNSNEDEYIKLLKELYTILTPLNNDVDVVHENPTITYKNPQFEEYFTRTMKQLAARHAQQTMFVKCNAELDLLLEAFLKNKNHVVWPADEIPILLNPHSSSTIEIARTPHSRKLIEMLWVAMTSEEYANDHIRSTRCCMSGDSCYAITVICNYNLFSTTKAASVRMFRMRPYEMLAASTWEGNNPYTTCYFCVSDFFWKKVLDAQAKGSLSSIRCSLPFVKEGNDANSFPRIMYVNEEDSIASYIAHMSGSVLKADFYSHIYFDDQTNGFRYIGDRFAKH